MAMKKTLLILLTICILAAVGVVWHICVDAVQLHKIELYASKVEEPAYTLVVNGKIIHHNYMASFDRFHTDPDTNELCGWEDGRINVPLLTVLSALGADVKWEGKDRAVINYAGESLVFLPEYEAVFPYAVYTGITTGQIAKERALNESNLIILPDDRTADFVRIEDNECLLQLGGCHLLAMHLGFTFECDFEQGILYFTN